MAHKCTHACTAGWSGSQRCHCSHCGENFSTSRHFTKHWTLDGCVHPSTLKLIQNSRGDWSEPDTEGYRDRFIK